MDALKHIDNILYQSLDNYFRILSHIGYKQYCAVDKLLIIYFIQEMIDGVKDRITEEDYNTMAKVVECISGSCIIPYTQYNLKEEETYLFYS